MNCISCFIIGFATSSILLAVLIFIYAYIWKKDIIDTYNRGKSIPDNPEDGYVG